MWYSCSNVLLMRESCQRVLHISVSNMLHALCRNYMKWPSRTIAAEFWTLLRICHVPSWANQVQRVSTSRINYFKHETNAICMYGWMHVFVYLYTSAPPVFIRVGHLNARRQQECRPTLYTSAPHIVFREVVSWVPKRVVFNGALFYNASDNTT